MHTYMYLYRYDNVINGEIQAKVLGKGKAKRSKNNKLTKSLAQNPALETTGSHKNTKSNQRRFANGTEIHTA